jgi:hypothetical protein
MTSVLVEAGDRAGMTYDDDVRLVREKLARGEIDRSRDGPRF